ncbi:predicted protein [Plenodomus lingam JN3]|uniref:Predicted protein n=2 Tax=Leptosphaeria maculans TaxID=5022 RepID=E4ZQA8_LEPMJ|nr:predicted protein [Plenodomus lingam JN3]CBX93970.1 predicted protein [Plenodomus lingam JN3]
MISAGTGAGNVTLSVATVANLPNLPNFPNFNSWIDCETQRHLISPDAHCHEMCLYNPRPGNTHNFVLGGIKSTSHG